VKEIGRTLGVRYVLEGSVRKAQFRVRIAGQLIEAATGKQLWADRFDGALENIFDLQDQVTASVVGAIAPMVEQAENVRGLNLPKTSTPMISFCAVSRRPISKRMQQSVKPCSCSTRRPNSMLASARPTAWPHIASSCAASICG
jgi:hypothetical protein